MGKKIMIELSKRLPMAPCTEAQFAELANHMGKSPISNALVMSDGYQVGTRSKRRTYISATAYRVATGKSLTGYVIKK